MGGGASRPGETGYRRTALPGGIVWATLPLGALALIYGLDAVAQSRPWPLLVVGLLDEPAHLATAWIILTALLPARTSAIRPWALVGAVSIDLDHVPLYLWGALADADGGRPVTHSLVTVVVVAMAGAALPNRLRIPLVGLAVGVLMHLVRDVATGPGVPALWPIDPSVLLLPYADYLVFAGLVAALASTRRLTGPDGPARLRGTAGG
jgi:inner membrane protein